VDRSKGMRGEDWLHPEVPIDVLEAGKHSLSKKGMEESHVGRHLKFEGSPCAHEVIAEIGGRSDDQVGKSVELKGGQLKLGKIVPESDEDGDEFATPSLISRSSSSLRSFGACCRGGTSRCCTGSSEAASCASTSRAMSTSTGITSAACLGSSIGDNALTSATGPTVEWAPVPGEQAALQARAELTWHQQVTQGAHLHVRDDSESWPHQAMTERLLANTGPDVEDENCMELERQAQAVVVVHTRDTAQLAASSLKCTEHQVAYAHNASPAHCSWRERLSVTEASCDAAQCLASGMAESWGQMQRDHAARLSDLILETSRLQRETRALAGRAQMPRRREACDSVALVEHGSQGHAADDVQLGSSIRGAEISPMVAQESRSWDSPSPSAPSSLGVNNLCSTPTLRVCSQPDQSKSTEQPHHTARALDDGVDSILRNADSSDSPGRRQPKLHGGWRWVSGISQNDTSAPASSVTTTEFGDTVHAFTPTDSEMTESRALPHVYAQALAGIRHRGWLAVYPLTASPSWTVFHWAATEGRNDICLQLLAALADPRRLDDHGRSPLDCAREAGHVHLWDILASQMPDDAIHPAVAASSSGLSQVLAADPLVSESLKAPAASVSLPPAVPMPSVYAAAIAAVEHYGWHAVHVPGEAQWTALHWAALEGRASLCERLLNCHADPRQPDDTGRTALDYALERGHRNALRTLLTEVAATSATDAPPDLICTHVALSSESAALASFSEATPSGITLTNKARSTTAVSDTSAYPTSVRLPPREVVIPEGW